MGRKAAVADLGFVQFWGYFAWLFVHIYVLIGFRNGLVVLEFPALCTGVGGAVGCCDRGGRGRE